MSDNREIRTQVIAGILTTAAIGAGVWVFGLARPLIDWIARGSLSVPGYIVAVLGVLGVGLGARRLIRHRVLATPSALAIEPQRPTKGLEVRPVSFALDLRESLPRVRVDLLAINYLAAPLSLRHTVVSRLTFESGFPALDGIGLMVEIELGPFECRVVHCERALADSEARAVRPSAGRRLGGALSLVARGVSGGNEFEYLASSLVVVGWADTPPPDAA